MLDSVTKKRIDDLRNILVGKIPSPQSQVEQITTGLIYKFMHDMDNEAIEMGGVPSFFVDEYEKYSWKHLFNSKLLGVEKVKLYSDAIENLYTNPNAPSIFREIFKNAFLPFKDPSTLNMFLKEINEFHYSNSEKLGDAYEYLLSFMGSQGDAGQFRTPRHIIDFIISIINPQKNESILDPACGTSGFLISSYKHILNQNTQTKIGDKLNASERKQIGDNLVGYDIDPSMSRISLVNMYLHNFASPNINEYDTLSSDERWNEYFDVILANPPFFSPTGGIKPHSRFGVKSTRAEVLFVDYIMEHLKPNGRAGIIVPEGIIFQTGNAYKTLRKKLVEDYLVGVISLPGGVFQPYSGVKTSILILDKELNQKIGNIVFAKVENDGFSLGAQRIVSDKNDLPKIAEEILNYLISNKKSEILQYSSKEEILSKSDCSLTSPIALSKPLMSDFDFVSITDVASFTRGITYKKSDEVSGEGVGVLRANNIQLDGNLNLSDIKWISKSVKIKDEQWLKKDDLFICIASGSKDHIGKTHLINEELNYAFGGFMGVLRANSRVLPYFLKSILQTQKFNSFLREAIYGANINNIKKDTLEQFKFPLPPIEEQKKIISVLKDYQKVIDGCTQIIENYKPTINIDPSWDYISVGMIFENITETKKPDEIEFRTTKYIGLEHIEKGKGILSKEFTGDIDEIKSNKNLFKAGDILFAKLRPNLNKVVLVDFDGICSTDILVLRAKESISAGFYHSIFLSEWFNQEVMKGISGAQLPRTKFSFISEINVPYPNKIIQDTIFESIAKEKIYVQGTNKLIQLYTRKIQDKISKVWDISN